GFDGGLGAFAGFAIGAILSVRGKRPGAPALALGLAAAYALLRSYDPPGLGLEAAFALVAAAVAAAAVVLAGDDAEGVLGFLHLDLLATVAVAVGGFAVDEIAGSRRWGSAV